MSEPITEKPDTIAGGAEGKKYGGRSEMLGRSGKLAEDEVEIDGVTYIVRELTGSQRATVIGVQAEARLANKIDLGQYQKQLLLYGLVDPESPVGARQPALTKADLAAVMENGAGFLDPLLDKIEKLSGLSVDAKKAAEDFLGGTPNGPATSDSPES